MINPFIMMREVEDYFHIKKGSLTDLDRHKTTAHARIICMYLFRCVYNYSYMEIADYFNRDHSTVVKNCKKLVNSLHNDRSSLLACDTLKLLNKFKGENYV